MKKFVEHTDLLTQEKLENQITTKVFGKKIYYKEEIDSTNMEAGRLAFQNEPHGLLVIAEKQTMGKGRMGRNWSSPKGSGIWMSLLLKPDLEPRKASMLTLVTAISVADAIRKVTGLEALIKWPNDIVIGKKKVCGILTEMNTQANKIHHVIIGIGINVNTEQFLEEIKEIATSLLIEKRNQQNRSDKINRAVLIGELLKQLEENFELFLKNGDLKFLMEQYNKNLVSNNKEVKILNEKNEFTGIAKGINEKGELLVETNEEIIAVCSGEVSVRGLYGYV